MSDPAGPSGGSQGAYNFKRPLPAHANAEIKEEFADYHAKGPLADPKYSKFSIWQIFAEQFEHFDEDAFEALPAAIKTSLRDALVSRGVRVHKARGLRIGKALHQALEDGLDWSQEGEEDDENTVPTRPSAPPPPKSKEPLAFATASGFTDAKEPPPPPQKPSAPLRRPAPPAASAPSGLPAPPAALPPSGPPVSPAPSAPSGPPNPPAPTPPPGLSALSVSADPPGSPAPSAPPDLPGSLALPGSPDPPGPIVPLGGPCPPPPVRGTMAKLLNQ